MRYAWTPKFQSSGPTVHSYTVVEASAQPAVDIMTSIGIAFVLALDVEAALGTMWVKTSSIKSSVSHDSVNPARDSLSCDRFKRLLKANK